MKMLPKLALFSALTISSMTALADGSLRGFHPFVGFAGGYGQIIDNIRSQINNHHDLNAVVNGDNIGGFAWRANAGVLWYITNFAFGVEAAYSDYPNNRFYLLGLDNNSRSTVTHKAHSADVLAVGKYFVLSNLNVGAKVGMSYMWQTILAPSDMGMSATVNRSEALPVLGLSMAYSLTKHLDFTFDAQYVFGNTTVIEIGSNGNGGSGPVLIDVKSPVMSYLFGLAYNF